MAWLGTQDVGGRVGDTVAKDNYRARTLIREIVLSIPFRNSQGGAMALEAAPAAPRRRPRKEATK